MANRVEHTMRGSIADAHYRQLHKLEPKRQIIKTITDVKCVEEDDDDDGNENEQEEEYDDEENA